MACQNARMISNAPLSEAQFDRLDDFLMSDDAPDDTMDTAMLDGYLAAVASGPNLIMPSEMLRWVWDTEKGEDAPEFKSAQEAQQIIGLVMQHYQNVNDTFNQFPQDYEPRIMEREHEGRVIPIIDEWCMGYYKGMALDLQAWSPLLLKPAATVHYHLALWHCRWLGNAEEKTRISIAIGPEPMAWPTRRARFTPSGSRNARSKSRAARCPALCAASSRCAAARKSGATTPAPAAVGASTSTATERTENHHAGNRLQRQRVRL